VAEPHANQGVTYVVGPGARVLAAPDGGFAAVIEPAQITVVELRGGTPVTELALAQPAPDVAWIGTPPRLVVVARGAAYRTAQVIDPHGVDPVEELRIESSMQLLAATGPYALLVGAHSAGVLELRGGHVTQGPFLTRAFPTVAGVAPGRFMVVLADVIEEWDPQQRVPKRRLRLPRNGTITALGATARVVWMTARQDPARISVITLINKGQPSFHELPEPIASVVGHPQRDTIVCLGRDSGRLYVVDLEGRSPLRALERDGLESVALYAARIVGLVAARAGHPLALIDLDGRDVADSPRPVAVAVVPAISAQSAVIDEPVPVVASLPMPSPMPSITLSTAQAELAAAAVEPPIRVDQDDSAYPYIPPRPPRPPVRDETPLAPRLASLGPRSSLRRCSAGQYHAFLEHHRRSVAAVAVRAIARDWDTGRLAFNTQDRPPFEAEVLGIAGRRGGLATQRVVEASEALDHASDELRIAKTALADRLTPLDVLCIEHGISKTGELVLMHVAAPAMWGELARLYGVLANDEARATCDEHLLWQLLGETVTRRELSRELDPDAPLIRHGLIRAGDRQRPFQALAPDAIVVKLLAGSDVEGDSERGIERVAATVPLDRFLAPRAVIERALADLAAVPPGAGRVVVRGRDGSGRRTLLAALAELAGRTLATIDAAMLIREKRIAALPGMLQHANLRGWLPCIDGLETIPSDDPSVRGKVRELLRDHDGPVAIRLPRHVQPPLEPDYVLIELPPSTIAERAEQWSDALAAHGLAVRDLDELAARFTVGAGTVSSVVETIARTAPSDVDRAIEHTMRQHLEIKLGEVASRVTRLADWSQIVLPAEIKDSIVELIARVRHRRTVYDTWGFDQVMSTSRGLTALFQGGPGTGKTLVAGAIANELGLDLYRIDLSRVMSKWIGETEQNLAKVFDAAEEGQALILFDEADSLFGKRTEVRTSRSTTCSSGSTRSRASRS
jgi:hypothetical protein